MMPPKYHLEFIVAQSDPAIAKRYLLQSPCLSDPGYPLHIHENVNSAAEAFNRYSLDRSVQDANSWWVWIHQDVYLPQGWDSQFQNAIATVEHLYPKVGILGLYGIQSQNSKTTRVGSLIDRGEPLIESAAMPALVDSLDELLIATRADLHLSFDPLLGFDLYGTDLVLEAKKRGIEAAVVHAPCEHWSKSPKLPPFAPQLVERITHSARYFEQKWQRHFPITTPCFEIHQPGDIHRFITQSA